MDATSRVLPPPMGGVLQDSEMPTTAMPPDVEKSQPPISRSPPHLQVLLDSTSHNTLPSAPSVQPQSHLIGQLNSWGKGTKRLAAREASRQRLLLTAWEIEEAKRFSTFLDAVHAEEEERLKSTEEELQDFRRIFSQRSQADIDGDTTYLQAVYEDECKVLRMIGTQADEVANLLGKCAKQSFLRFTGDSSPYATNESGIGNRVRTREPSTPKDSEGWDDMGACRDDDLKYSDEAQGLVNSLMS